ncbi:expressed unknown protein [Seminavis robusta]|uniref:Uncharacterized protein n=1 Tax=Seminavis robusta TaxID=568900 RepID=A0A9N8D532_9STRA|nr:expressed unknown protein [Seminavis robusta]|eukprot:Sro7_g005920.1 n/a (258) ;mRNA; f:88585-89358
MPAQAAHYSPTSTTEQAMMSCSSSSRLRTLRRSFVQEDQKPLLDIMLQYGNLSLTDRKLDSWIDSAAPQPHHIRVHKDKDTCVLDDSSSDHLSRRVSCLSKRRNRLSRSWSGNICMIQQDSLIDVLPKAAGDVTGRHKRSKPRRASGDAATLIAMRRGRNPRPKDVLVEGDLQTVRKVVLEKKLLRRPLIPNYMKYNHDDNDSTGLLAEILRTQQQQDDADKKHHAPPHRRGVLRSNSLNSAVLLSKRHLSVMPSSA